MSKERNKVIIVSNLIFKEGQNADRNSKMV
jgi:hypothetical protein